MIDRDEGERRARAWLAEQPWAAERELVLRLHEEDPGCWTFAVSGPQGETLFGAPLVQVEKASGAVRNLSAVDAAPVDEASDLLWGCGALLGCGLVLAVVVAGVFVLLG